MASVLIADDEELACQALEKMLHSRFPETCVLPSVHDGLELVETVLRETPDIAIVDINMPGLNGLEALERLHAENIQMEIIIYTAYSDFDFIHKALKLGARDYLVKPVFEEDFAESFSQVLQGVEEKKHSAGGKWAMPDSADKVLEDTVMMSLLLHQPNEESWELLQSSAGTGDDGGGLIAAFRFQSCTPEEAPEDVLCDALLSAVRRHCHCLSIRHQDICYCYLPAACLPAPDACREWLKSWLPDVLRSMQDSLEAELRVGISCFHDQFSDMAEAVDEADHALLKESESKIAFYNYEREKRTAAENIFAGQSANLAQYLCEGKTEQGAEAMENLLRKDQKEQGVDFATCFYAEELFVNTALLLDMDKRRTGMRWTIQERLKELGTEEVKISPAQFHALLENALLQLQEDLKRPIRKANVYVEKALIYMERNYMKEDISLESAADSIGITQFYLSRLLKQERNQTFLEVLTDIRISHAIRLLLDPGRSVQSVSRMVGYHVKYFYQVFKSATGMSQREFRRRFFAEE